MLLLVLLRVLLVLLSVLLLKGCCWNLHCWRTKQDAPLLAKAQTLPDNTPGQLLLQSRDVWEHRTLHLLLLYCCADRICELVPWTATVARYMDEADVPVLLPSMCHERLNKHPIILKSLVLGIRYTDCIGRI